VIVQASLSFSNLVILLGSVQGFFLAFILWNWNKGSRTSHRLLSATLFAFALSMIWFVLWDSKYILSVPHLSMIEAPFENAIGPLFFLYTLSLTKKDFVFKRVYWLHFIPFIATIFYFIPFYTRSAEEKIAFNEQSYHQLPNLWFYFSVFSTLYNVVYILLMMLVIARHQRTVKKYYSSTGKVNLRWMQLLFLQAVFAFVTCVFLGFIGFRNANAFSNIVFSITIYAMGYYGMKQKEIFGGFHEEINTDAPEALVIATPEETQKKYEKSGLKQDKANQLLHQLDDLMNSEKLYLEPELNLQQLADRLGVSIHHVSQVLNQYKRQSFFDYVNQLRVEEFKLQLMNPDKQHLSLLGLAFECGFNSKAAFNIAFKKQTGLTPSAYRNNMRADAVLKSGL
jgi:AraC-like DNA-binding protein